MYEMIYSLIKDFAFTFITTTIIVSIAFKLKNFDNKILKLFYSCMDVFNKHNNKLVANEIILKLIMSELEELHVKNQNLEKELKQIKIKYTPRINQK